MLEAGVDLFELQQILGHVSILTTVTGNNVRRAVNSLVESLDIKWGGHK